MTAVRMLENAANTEMERKKKYLSYKQIIQRQQNDCSELMTPTKRITAMYCPMVGEYITVKPDLSGAKNNSEVLDRAWRSTNRIAICFLISQATKTAPSTWSDLYQLTESLSVAIQE